MQIFTGEANLFCGTDPKLCQYNFVESFFGGVAPLVRQLLCKRSPSLASCCQPLQHILLLNTCQACTMEG